MKAVVTGGTGVLGRSAVSALTATGHDVVVVSRSPENDAAAQSRGARAVRGDLFDVDSLEAAYAGADVVINLATHVPVGFSALLPGAWRHHDRLHTAGVANVVEAIMVKNG